MLTFLCSGLARMKMSLSEMIANRLDFGMCTRRCYADLVDFPFTFACRRNHTLDHHSDTLCRFQLARMKQELHDLTLLTQE